MAHFSYTLTDELMKKIKESGISLIETYRNTLGDHYGFERKDSSIRSMDYDIINAVINDTKIKNISRSSFVECILRQHFKMELIDFKYMTHKGRASDFSERVKLFESGNGSELMKTRKNYRDLIDIVRCVRCGYDRHISTLHVHHLDGNHENDDPGNLIVLCANCHSELHNNLWNISEITHALVNHQIKQIVTILTPISVKLQSKIEKTYKCERCKLESEDLVSIYRKSGSQSLKKKDVVELCLHCSRLHNRGKWKLEDVKVIDSNIKRSRKYTPKMFINVITSRQPITTKEIIVAINCYPGTAEEWLARLEKNGIIKLSGNSWVIS